MNENNYYFVHKYDANGNNVNDYNNKPINYLEIRTFYDANLILVGLTYGFDKESKLYYIDPLQDYHEYSKYKNKQPNIFNTFIENNN